MNYAYSHPKDNEIYWSPVPKPEEELCYFLEEQTGSWFVDHGIRFTNNPLKAKRFKTKRDAEKLFRGVAFPSCKVTEHLFIPDRSALKAFEDGLVKFESQDEIRRRMPNDAWGRNSFDPDWNPDACIPIEVEGMRIWQRKENGIWIDDTKDISNLSNLMYREVFRITK